MNTYHIYLIMLWPNCKVSKKLKIDSWTENCNMEWSNTGIVLFITPWTIESVTRLVWVWCTAEIWAKTPWTELGNVSALQSTNALVYRLSGHALSWKLIAWCTKETFNTGDCLFSPLRYWRIEALFSYLLCCSVGQIQNIFYLKWVSCTVTHGKTLVYDFCFL